MTFTKDPSTHPANGPLTEERLRKIAALPTKTLTDGRQIAHGVISTVRTIEVVQMARQILASMEQEPEGEVVLGDYDDCGDYPDAKVVCIAAQGQADWNNFRNGTKLYAAPQLPHPSVLSVPDEIPKLKDGRGYKYVKDGVRYSLNYANGWNQCRAAMLQAGNSPVIPDGYMLVPKKLTAENGAKSALSGEFSETKFINCPECFGDDDCETCDGSGRIEITVPVSWTNIKAIWAKGIEHFTTVPHEENI
ncbi:hypothetical protein [Citrobacter braakii]|uniref:hypothetical protein n=1 Tax=Citrobacter braakii TaxID=57706 RepID=UPI0024B06B6A|nr:hypothetical protein [Citrobacter braakii]WFX02522.1 hypothetical protein NFJ89_06075 [Citrobacter braakii]